MSLILVRNYAGDEAEQHERRHKNGEKQSHFFIVYYHTGNEIGAANIYYGRRP